MRMRLIGLLAALMMIAPVAGFARTSTPIAQPTYAVASSTAKASHKKKKKMMKKKGKNWKKSNKKMHHKAKNKKKTK